MDKYSEIYGVDVSKDFFDVYSERYGHERFKNDENGFHGFLESLTVRDLVVMEATGYYHSQLADFLLGLEVPTSVVNPLSVKRFIQMRLGKVKTDRSDAFQIREYAQVNEVPLYKGRTPRQAERLQLSRYLDVLVKQRTVLKNKLHGEHVLGFPAKMVSDCIEEDLEHLRSRIERVRQRLDLLVREDYAEQLTVLKSIPGIGERTAIYLLLMTEGFTKFENAGQLVSYAGISPTIRESGSSVKGKSRISKMGNKKLRNLLFMCSFNACKSNLACKRLYDRLVAKGKSKKLALIAVSNKLLRQAFAVATSRMPYCEDHRSVLS
jgi:transposase